MIKRIVYTSKDKSGYWPVVGYTASDKEDIAQLFETFDLHHYWMIVDKGPEEVLIWNLWKKEDYPDEDDIPKLGMTRKNYDEVIAAWNANIEVLKPYLILSQDETGWIRLETKDELSPEDLAAIEQDRQAGIEWEANWKKQFVKNNYKKRFWDMIEKIKGFLGFR